MVQRKHRNARILKKPSTNWQTWSVLPTEPDPRTQLSAYPRANAEPHAGKKAAAYPATQEGYRWSFWEGVLILPSLHDRRLLLPRSGCRLSALLSSQAYAHQRCVGWPCSGCRSVEQLTSYVVDVLSQSPTGSPTLKPTKVRRGKIPHGPPRS